MVDVHKSINTDFSIWLYYVGSNTGNDYFGEQDLIY